MDTGKRVDEVGIRYKARVMLNRDSPPPNYPNFEAVRRNGSDSRVGNYGQIGWGVNNPNLAKDTRFTRDHVPKLHVRYWDKKESQKFMDLTGKFSFFQDKQFGINPELFNLMNTSAQKVSIKSLDMKVPSMNPNSTLGGLSTNIQSSVTHNKSPCLLERSVGS